jgi:hypothetical protein
MDCGSGGSQPRDGLCDKKAGAESFILSPGLNCNLEPDSSIDMSDNNTIQQSDDMLGTVHAHMSCFRRVLVSRLPLTT